MIQHELLNESFKKLIINVFFFFFFFVFFVWARSICFRCTAAM